MEDRLRATLSNYREQILGTTADASITKEAFVNQVAAAVGEVDSLPLSSKPVDSSSLVKIVSIDLQKSDVLAVVGANANKLTSFIEQINRNEKTTADPQNSVADQDKLFVSNPHVTMCHHGEVTQPFIHETYDAVRDKEVEIAVTGLLWSESIAAFAVLVPNTTSDGHALPPSRNQFPHVTLWHLPEVAPVSSNDLPALVDSGQAQCVHFDPPVVLCGKVSFWDMKKH